MFIKGNDELTPNCYLKEQRESKRLKAMSMELALMGGPRVPRNTQA
jgi:hypothetical protein